MQLVNYSVWPPLKLLRATLRAILQKYNKILLLQHCGQQFHWSLSCVYSLQHCVKCCRHYSHFSQSHFNCQLGYFRAGVNKQNGEPGSHAVSLVNSVIVCRGGSRGGEMGEFFPSPLLSFFLSLNYLNNIWFLWCFFFCYIKKKFTTHFKILDPRLVWSPEEKTTLINFYLGKGNVLL